MAFSVVQGEVYRSFSHTIHRESVLSEEDSLVGILSLTGGSPGRDNLTNQVISSGTQSSPERLKTKQLRV